MFVVHKPIVCICGQYVCVLYMHLLHEQALIYGIPGVDVHDQQYHSGEKKGYVGKVEHKDPADGRRKYTAWKGMSVCAHRPITIDKQRDVSERVGVL